MFTSPFDKSAYAHKEGDLYKIISLYGKTIEIRYGYYEEIDRRREPVEVYPDFVKAPLYTDEGFPFVTLMQDACPHYARRNAGGEAECGNCLYVERGEELIALCKCPRNRRNE